MILRLLRFGIGGHEVIWLQGMNISHVVRWQQKSPATKNTRRVVKEDLKIYLLVRLFSKRFLLAGFLQPPPTDLIVCMIQFDDIPLFLQFASSG